jgi:hypothetical protein
MAALPETLLAGGAAAIEQDTVLRRGSCSNISNISIPSGKRAREHTMTVALPPADPITIMGRSTSVGRESGNGTSACAPLRPCVRDMGSLSPSTKWR